MFQRRAVFSFVVASSLAAIALAGLLIIGRIVTPQQPAVQVPPQTDAEAASRAMTFSPAKDGSP